MSERVGVAIHLTGATVQTSVHREDAEQFAAVMRKAWEDDMVRGAVVVNSRDGSGPIAVRLSAVQAVQFDLPGLWGTE